MSSTKKSGNLDISSIFQSAANGMLTAVKYGKILHASKNIRESGAMLEKTIRGFFSLRLPSNFKVGQGYLFDSEFKCTPQIDLFISKAESQVFFETDDGAIYLPFVDALLIAEIKPSTHSMAAHLKQFSKTLAMHREMLQNLSEKGLHSHFTPITVLFIAECPVNYEKAVAKHKKENRDTFPDYIFIVETGQIIGKSTSFWEELIGGEEGAIPPNYNINGRDLAIYSLGKDNEQKRGNALLWLFYTILLRLQEYENESIRSVITELCKINSDMDLSRVAHGTQRLYSGFYSDIIRNIRLEREKDLV